MLNLMNVISTTLISVASADVISTAYFDGQGISFDDNGIANYRLIEQSKRNHFELWILWSNGDFNRYEGELSAEAQSVANMLFDVAWLRESEVDEEEAVYQEDRFGVPVEVLRYETKSFVQNTNVTSTVYAVDPSVPF
nr:MAG TPA: hypothetical protein [Caudoviricetes sp.]